MRVGGGGWAIFPYPPLPGCDMCGTAAWGYSAANPSMDSGPRDGGPM